MLAHDIVGCNFEATKRLRKVTLTLRQETGELPRVPKGGIVLVMQEKETFMQAMGRMGLQNDNEDWKWSLCTDSISSQRIRGSREAMRGASCGRVGRAERGTVATSTKPRRHRAIYRCP